MPKTSPLNICQMTFGDAVPPLGIEDIYIWLLPLAQSLPAPLTLTPDEQVRASRFRFDHDRHRWIAARIMLRSLLGWYTVQEPLAVRLDYTDYDKPFLPDFPHIGFNLSHAGDYGVLAVAHERTIGVDIEYIRPHFADPAIAKHFFSAAEQAALASVSAGEYATAFFTCWVRKESYIKARGEGLSRPLQSFDVAIQPNAPELLLETRPDDSEKANWHMEAVSVPDGYLAALTIGCTANT